jgi:hypothetical protein
MDEHDDDADGDIGDFGGGGGGVVVIICAGATGGSFGESGGVETALSNSSLCIDF